MNSLATLINTDQKISTSTKKNDTIDLKFEEKIDTEDFVKILYTQMKDNNEESSLDELSSLSIDNNSKKTTTKDEKSKSSDEILLDEVLNIINQLKSGDESSENFPKFSDKMDRILDNESIKNDFKSVKNLDDLLSLSKKYDLGLEKIEFTSEDTKKLKDEFPKLDFENFFDSKDSKKYDSSKNLKDISQTKNRNFTDTVAKNSYIDTSSSSDKIENILQNILEKIDNGKKDLPTSKSDYELKKDTKRDDNIKMSKTPFVTDSKSKISAEIQEQNSGKTVQNIKNTSVKISSSSEIQTLLSKRENRAKSNSNAEKIREIQTQDSFDEIEKYENMKESTKSDVEKTNNLKKSIPESVKVEKNQTSQNSQDQILHKIKPQKRAVLTTDYTQNQNNNKISNETDSDLKPETKEIKSEPTQSRHELNNKTQISDTKNIKQNDTKSSLNSFSNDLKEKIEQYKPPIMKVQMTLNPKNLGEVDVTILNRGNNLHVNITSNTNTMSLFTQNQAEFKNSLVNMGFTNLEMNFSDQGQNQQNQQNSKKQNGSFEEFNQQEEYESSIELVVPKYI